MMHKSILVSLQGFVPISSLHYPFIYISFWWSYLYFEVQLCFTNIFWTLWFSPHSSQVDVILSLIFAYLLLFLPLIRGNIVMTCEQVRVKSQSWENKGKITSRLWSSDMNTNTPYLFLDGNVRQMYNMNMSTPSQ